MAARAQVPLVGVGVVLRHGEEWLLQRRANVHGDGMWSTAGGHLDLGEDPADCARREVAEETGLSVTEVEFLGVTNDVFEGGRHYVTLWFEALAFGGTATLSAPGEMSDLRWFPRAELPEPLFPPLRRLLAGDCLGPGLA